MAEADWEKEVRVRGVLEEMAQGSSLSDSVLVPLMEANDYDVDTCVDALLELISDGPSNTEQEQRELEEELEYYQQCREAADEQAAATVSPKSPSRKAQEAISEELRRVEELEMARLAAEEEERVHFAQMRQDLEAEWLQRLEAQRQELAVKQQALEAERKATLAKQLEAVSAKRSPEFKNQVESALKQRLAERKKKEEVVEYTSWNSSSSGEGAESEGVAVELTCPEQAEVGAKITVFWEYKRGKPTGADWIGYYKKSRPELSNQYYTYQKTGGLPKGKLEFTVPSKLGICEVRMFQNNGYTMIGRSRPIRVGNSVQLSVSVEEQSVAVSCHYSDKAKQHSSWDWLALYEDGESDNRAYLDGCSSYITKDTLRFPLRKPGRYVARYFQSGSGYSELAESTVFEVADKDWVKVTTPSADLKRSAVVQVEWNIESVAPSSKDRVALFRAGEFNPLLPLSIQPTHCNKPQGVLKFLLSPGLAPGQFEFVFIPKGHVKPVKKSAPFELL